MTHMAVTRHGLKITHRGDSAARPPAIKVGRRQVREEATHPSRANDDPSPGPT
jgi:hypothetical protein